ncbi:MAG: hypothetical protein ACLP0L_25250, partial [Solirubrobacteraceae bacterium]
MEAIGEIETEDRVLLIKRIHVRYRLAIPEERRDHVGYLRLDTQTGEVALCSQRSVGWACEA